MRSLFEFVYNLPDDMERKEADAIINGVMRRAFGDLSEVFGDVAVNGMVRSDYYKLFDLVPCKDQRFKDVVRNTDEVIEGKE